MLTGSEIAREVANGRIYIEDFNPERIGPNSYDLHIGDTLKIVCPNQERQIDDRHCLQYLDMKKDQVVREYVIDSECGYILNSGYLYLIPTLETVGSEFYVPQIVGRSSIGRMGIQISQHAAFGDLGFIGKWTLQVTTVYPTRIYPKMRMCQVYFEEIQGENSILYNGKYNHAEGAMESKFNVDLK